MDDQEYYSRRQDRENANYKKEYLEWVKSMSPEELKNLQDLGLDRPDVISTSINTGYSKDVAETSGSSYDPATFIPISDEKEPEEVTDTPSKYEINIRISEAIQSVITQIVSSPNPLLTVECLMLASGIAYQGASETSIAKKHGLTRAAISKRCIVLADNIGIKNLRAMRSQKVRDQNRLARIKTHNKSNK